MVFFLRKVIWTVPDFTVERYRDRLRVLHDQIERDGSFRSTMFPWSNADRAGFAAIAATLQAAGPAIRRGAMSQLWPEGTPHLAPGSRSRVIEAPPQARRRPPVEAATA